MKQAQLRRLSNKRTKSPTPFILPLRKETPRSSPLFIYSCRSPADIPLALLRRPTNKHTVRVGVGGLWGKGRSWKPHFVKQQLRSRNCDATTLLCSTWCFSTCSRGEMLGMCRMVNLTERKMQSHFQLKGNVRLYLLHLVLETLCWSPFTIKDFFYN